MSYPYGSYKSRWTKAPLPVRYLRVKYGNWRIKAMLADDDDTGVERYIERIEAVERSLNFRVKGSPLLILPPGHPTNPRTIEVR